MSLVLAALLASVQSTAVQEQPPAAPTSSPAPAPAKAKQKLICKVDDADSGTRMAKRICRTVDEWNNTAQLGTGRSGLSISGEAVQSQGH